MVKISPPLWICLRRQRSIVKKDGYQKKAVNSIIRLNQRKLNFKVKGPKTSTIMRFTMTNPEDMMQKGEYMGRDRQHHTFGNVIVTQLAPPVRLLTPRVFLVELQMRMLG